MFTFKVILVHCGVDMTKNDLKQLYENAGVSLPNENSLGKKIVPDDDPIKLQNFWNWFGDSKVVDEQGRPLVVYHNSGASHNILSKDYARTSVEIQGIFFSPKKDPYKEYGPYEHIVYLKIVNPADFKTAYIEHGIKLGEKDDSGIKIRKWLQDNGYDGVMLYEDGELTEIITFESNQIKSVNNAGTFSSASNNIYEATAYHGTPHSFNEFSLKHISSGEGHQVHGWGLYFSLDKEIASNYRTILGTKKNNKLEDWQDKLLYEIRINGFDTVEFDLKYALKRAMESEDYPEKEADIELFKKQLAFAESLVDVNGTLFTVDVPENDVLLNENASLSNQPSMVQQVIKESIVEIYGKYLKKFDYKIKEDIEDKICEYVDADDSLSKDDKWHINYIVQKMFSIDVISEEEPITPDELKDKWLKTIQMFVDSKKHVLDYVKERNDDEAIEKYRKDIMRAEYFQSLIPDIMKLITNQNGDLIFFKEDMKRFVNEETGKTFYGHLAAYLEANMSMKTSQTISRYCLASMWLLKQGVQGIKYHGGLDGDCVVIFNPKRVKILRKE